MKCSVYYIDTDEIPTEKHNFFFYSFSKQQNSAIKVVTYRKMPVTKMLWNSDINLQRRNKDNNTYIFCSEKSKF